MSTDLVCITCPLGCQLRVESRSDGSLEVSGNRCPRGRTYAEEELLAPKRMLTATARLLWPDGAEAGLLRLPVRSASALPKEALGPALAAVYALELRPPLRRGQVVLHDVAGSGVDILACRSV